MIRLQRVTFLALHDYLGLTTELTRSRDGPSQVQQSQRIQGNHGRRGRMHTSSYSRVAEASVDSVHHPEDDLMDNDAFQPTRLISTISEMSPSSDQIRLIKTPELTNTKKESTTSSLTGRTVPSTRQKQAGISFAGQRSMSVIENRVMNPDFEEAAARARVKNSLDTTFFEKHRISYPNVPNFRQSNSSVTKRRSSFSDVNFSKLSSLHLSFFFFSFH